MPGDTDRELLSSFASLALLVIGLRFGLIPGYHEEFSLFASSLDLERKIL
jgi:hypothetical protein